MLSNNLFKKISFFYFGKPLKLLSPNHKYKACNYFCTEKQAKHLPAPYLSGLLSRWKIKKNNIKQVYDNILSQLTCLNSIVKNNEETRVDLKLFREKLEETGLDLYFFSENHSFFKEIEFINFLNSFISLLKTIEDPWDYIELLDIATKFHLAKYKNIEYEIFEKLVEITSGEDEENISFNKKVIIKICIEFPDLFCKLHNAKQIILSIGEKFTLNSDEKIEYLSALACLRLSPQNLLTNEEIAITYNRIISQVKINKVNGENWGQLLLSLLRTKTLFSIEKRFDEIIQNLISNNQLNNLSNSIIVRLFNTLTLLEESRGKLRMNLYEEILRRLQNFSVIDLEVLIDSMITSDSNTEAIKYRLDNEILYKKSIIIDIFQKRLFNQSQNVVFHSKILIKLMSRLPVYDIKEAEVLRKCEELCCIMFEFERFGISELILTFKYILKSATNTKFAPRNIEEIIEKLFQEGKISDSELNDCALNILISADYLKTKLTYSQNLYLLENIFNYYSSVNKINVPYLCDLMIYLSKRFQQLLTVTNESENDEYKEYKFILDWLTNFIKKKSIAEILIVQQMFLRNLILRPQFLNEKNGILIIIDLITARFREKRTDENLLGYFSNFDEIFKANKNFFKLNKIEFVENLALVKNDENSTKIKKTLIFPFPVDIFLDQYKKFANNKNIFNIVDVLSDDLNTKHLFDNKKISRSIDTKSDSLINISKHLMSDTSARDRLSKDSPDLVNIQVKLDEYFSKPAALGDDESINSAFYLTELLNYKKKLSPEFIRRFLDFIRKGNYQLKSNILLKAHSILNSYAAEYTGEMKNEIFIGIMNNLDRKLLNHKNAYELIMGFPLKSFDLGTLNYLENLIGDRILHFDIAHLGKILDKFNKYKLQLPYLIKKIVENISFLIKNINQDRDLEYANQIITALKSYGIFNKDDLNYLYDLNQISHLHYKECLHRFILLSESEICLSENKQKEFLRNLAEANKKGVFEAFDNFLCQLIINSDNPKIDEIIGMIENEKSVTQLTLTKINFAAKLISRDKTWLQEKEKHMIIQKILELIFNNKKYEYIINSLFFIEYNNGLLSKTFSKYKSSLDKFLNLSNNYIDSKINRALGTSEVFARLIYVISCLSFKGKYEFLNKLKMQQWKLVTSNEAFCNLSSLKLIFSAMALNSLELHTFLEAKSKHTGKLKSEFENYFYEDDDSETLKNIPFTLYDEYTLNRIENQITKARKYYKDNEFKQLYIFYIKHGLGSATILKFLEETLGLIETINDKT